MKNIIAIILLSSSLFGCSTSQKRTDEKSKLEEANIKNEWSKQCGKYLIPSGDISTVSIRDGNKLFQEIVYCTKKCSELLHEQKNHPECGFHS